MRLHRAQIVRKTPNRRPTFDPRGIVPRFEHGDRAWERRHHDRNGVPYRECDDYDRLVPFPLGAKAEEDLR